MSTLQFHSLSPEVREELARMFNEHQRDIHPYKHITFSQLTFLCVRTILPTNLPTMFQKIIDDISFFFLKRRIKKIKIMMLETIISSAQLNNVIQTALLQSLLSVVITKAIAGLCIIIPLEERDKLIDLFVEQVKERIKELDKE